VLVGLGACKTRREQSNRNPCLNNIIRKAESYPLKREKNLNQTGEVIGVPNGMANWRGGSGKGRRALKDVGAKQSNLSKRGTKHAGGAHSIVPNPW